MAFTGELTQFVTGLSSADESSTTVTLSDGTTVAMPAGPFARPNRSILEALRVGGTPAYIRATDGVVQEVLAPRVGRIATLESLAPGRLVVEVEGTPERLILEGNRPSEALRLLESLSTGQPVAVATDRHRIVSVGVVPPMPAGLDVFSEFEVPPQPLSPDGVSQLLATISRVTEGEARELFAGIVRLNCLFPDEPSHDGCIPFKYSLGFCYARAHAVCERLQTIGVTSGKLWLFGKLGLATTNAPGDCREAWRFHVAPFVRADTGEDDLFILDPSVDLEKPLPDATWKRTIEGTFATPIVTSMAVQLLGSDFKPLKVKANFAHLGLVNARAEFEKQCRKLGAPPYVCTAAPGPDVVSLIG